MVSPMKDYSALDHPEISRFLFHPRSEMGYGDSDGEYEVLKITVEDRVEIGARFYPFDQQAPTLLFFHGNGEIVADYHDVALTFNHLGVNFFPVDYRGYGISTGDPSVSCMLSDCHTVFDWAVKYLSENGYQGPMIIMGRSLGSASALELAASHEGEVHGLIIESGFAFMLPLLQLVGIDTATLGLTEESGPRNYQKIEGIRCPVSIIHAEYDHIIPFTEGQYLFDNCPSENKSLHKIQGANHNDILAVGAGEYFNAVKSLKERVDRNAF